MNECRKPGQTSSRAHTWGFLRYLHTIICCLLVIIRVGRGRVGRELVLPLHCDGYVTTFQVPKEKEIRLTTRTLHVRRLKRCSSSTRQLLPNNTVEAADLLIGMDGVVFAGEVLQATRSTISDLQGRC